MTETLVVLFAIAAVSLGLTLFSHAAVQRVRLRRLAPGPTPGISVFKPLKGLDDGLYENLVAIARQNYPHFEILIGAESADDPALVVARQVQREFPHVPIRILHGVPTLGLNPKVNNLAMLSQAARYEYWLISDANVRPDADYLRAMAAEFEDPHVGLVSSLLAGTGAITRGAWFENLHLNSFIAGAVCGAQVLASHPCVVGKSVLFRRTALERLGGWREFANVLAEDYLMGRAFHLAGYRVALSSHVLPTVNKRKSVRQFLERHLRWNQMRRRINPALYLGEPLLNPVPWWLLVLATSLASPGAGPLGAATAAVSLGAVALKCVSDAALQRSLTGEFPALRSVLWIPIKDVLFAAVWVVAGLKRSVKWRGHVMRIGPGSSLFPSGGGRAPVEAVELA